MAQLLRTSYPLPGRDYAAPFSLDDAHERAFRALLERSAKLAPGQVVGGVVRFPRGDGYAYYLVTKDKPLTLQHIPHGDAWQADHMTIRGVRRQDVDRMLDRARNSLFNGRVS